MSATANAARRGQVEADRCVDGERRRRLARHVGEQVAAVVEVDARPGSRSRGTGCRAARRSTDTSSSPSRRTVEADPLRSQRMGGVDPEQAPRLLAPTARWRCRRRSPRTSSAATRRPVEAGRPARCRPPLKTAMRLLIDSASPWSWVTNTNVMPTSRWIALSSTCISSRNLRSRAPSGSSRSSTLGWLTSARARATRWR